MAKLAWFPFFPDDWLGSSKIAVMTREQEGVYIRLLAHAWNDPTCSLPTDPRKLAALGLTSDVKFHSIQQEIMECFIPHPTIEGRVINRRLSELRQSQEIAHDRKVQGGINRWKRGKDSSRLAQATHTGYHEQSESESEPEPDTREDSVSKKKHSSEPSASDVRLVTLRVVGEWNVGRPDAQKVRITPKRVQKVKARLKDGFSDLQVLQVVARLKASPFHNGDNDRGWRAPGPEWVLNSTEKVEQWLTGEPGRRVVRDAPARTCPNCGGGGMTPAGPCPGCPEGRAKRRAQ